MAMRRILLSAALVLALAVALVWWRQGANRGWTKTSIPVKTLDEVTGIEGIRYEQRFVPGIDFLGGGLLGAMLLAGASFLVRKNKTESKP